MGSSARKKVSLAPFLVSVAVAAGGVVGGGPAAAQDAATLQSIEAQITRLQAELRQLQREAAERDAELKRARAEARQAQSDAHKAVEQQKAIQLTTVPPPGSAPPLAPVAAAQSEPPLPPGTFRLGGVTLTLGGFAAAEGVYRSRNFAASVDTAFNSTPLPSSPNYHISEYRETAQQSRVSLFLQAPIDASQKVTSYVESDFLSAGSSSNSNQSNSYTPRLRQFWAEYDNSDLQLQFVGGQGWSLATLYKNGLQPRQENVPLTIDAQYVVGFNWARQAEFRVIKEFADRKISTAFSVEEPQTLFSGSAGPNCLTGAAASTASGLGTLEYTQCGGANVNSIQAYSDNYAPDLIAKVAADPGFGHYEVYGLLRFLGGRVSESGGGKNYTTTGQGIGGGMILPVIPRYVDFQVSGLVGQGVGRYGTSQLADATFSPDGKIEPISSYSLFGGFIAHPTPQVDVYAYGGTEAAARKYYTAGKTNSGYGNPNVSLAGCEVELGSCSANTSNLAEGSVGAWWRFLKGGYGTLEAGAQYQYVSRNTFSGLGAKKGTSVDPTTDLNAVLVSFRYIPFN